MVLPLFLATVCLGETEQGRGPGETDKAMDSTRECVRQYCGRSRFCPDGGDGCWQIFFKRKIFTAPSPPPPSSGSSKARRFPERKEGEHRGDKTSLTPPSILQRQSGPWNWTGSRGICRCFIAPPPSPFCPFAPLPHALLRQGLRKGVWALPHGVFGWLRP